MLLARLPSSKRVPVRPTAFPQRVAPAGGGLLDRFTGARQGSYLSDADLEVYVKAFERTGFRGGLNWYRNVDRNWEEAASLVERAGDIR
jgi:hypothetical protein